MRSLSNSALIDNFDDFLEVELKYGDTINLLMKNKEVAASEEVGVAFVLIQYLSSIKGLNWR